MFLGSYLPGNEGVEVEKEKSFFVKNLDDFKPEVNKEYAYYSNKNGTKDNVTVITGKITPAGNIEVKSGEKIFKVPSGALMDIPEKKEQAVEQAGAAGAQAGVEKKRNK